MQFFYIVQSYFVCFYRSTDTSRSNSLESAALAEELSSWLKSPHRDENRSIGVLHSPRVSPEMWSKVPDVIVDADIELGLNGK